MRYKSNLGFLSGYDYDVITYILAVIIVLIWAIGCIDISITSSHEHQENIYSLSNPTGDSNNFVLGLGSEGFDTYYYFYTEENGSYIWTK